LTTLSNYYKTIRKINIAFASLFNNIVLIRQNPNNTENQRFIVPIEYGDGEKYVKRLRGDPELQKKIQIALPRMSYEMVGFNYDASRKLNTNNKNFASSPSGGANALSMYNPVPYDFGFSLTIYTRNVEDGNQIIEQIIPYFTPDYSMKLNLVPEMGISKSVPIVLNDVQQIIESDGDFNSEVRTVIWSLKFTVKAFIFGAIKDTKLIANTTLNISTSTGVSSNFDGEGVCCTGEISKSYTVLPNGYGDYGNKELVYQGQSLDYAYATGKVQLWDANANTIIISDVCGDFKLNQPIIGSETLSIHIPIAPSVNTVIAMRITTTADPTNANANSYWTANTIVTEYPNT
jgi:hypothetical protein